MHYLIDGYNLLFALEDEKGSLRMRRERLISWLQAEFHSAKLKGTLVFDNAQGTLSRDYPHPLQIAYAPDKMGADAFLLELIEGSRTPSQLTLVTNDQGLSRKARSLGAHTLSTRGLLRLIQEKVSKRPTPSKRGSLDSKELDRLRKIFEERLQNPPDPTQF